MKFFRHSLGILSSLLFIPSVWTAAIDLHTHDIQRRAYSVKIDGTVARPWPNRKLMICYKSQSDSDDLDKLIMAAYDDLWAPAGMKDFFSGIERKVGCDTDSKELQVTSVRKTGKMATTVGYRSRGGMTMQFDPDPPRRMGNGDSKVAMAHELGHAFGLFHEHQRSDAYDNDHLKFNCKNLADYDAKKKAGKDMDKICSDYSDASDASFSAVDFLPFPEGIGLDESGDFDWDSLMRYGAKYGGAQQSLGRGRKIVLEKRDGTTLADPVKPSTGDIERLRALYSVEKTLAEMISNS